MGFHFDGHKTSNWLRRLSLKSVYCGPYKHTSLDTQKRDDRRVSFH